MSPGACRGISGSGCCLNGRLNVMNESAEADCRSRILQAEINTATSTAAATSAQTPSSPSCVPIQIPMPGSLLTKAAGPQDSANSELPRAPAPPGGRGGRRRDSILLMQTAAQVHELAFADATTGKTLDEIAALLASLKASSLVSAPVALAMPKLPMPTATSSSELQPVSAVISRSWSLVKSKFMDVHNKATAAEGDTALTFGGEVRRRSSCTQLLPSYRASNGDIASSWMDPAVSPTPASEGGCLPRGLLRLQSLACPARPTGSLAVALRHSRSSITGDSRSTAGPAALELSSNSLAGSGKALSPTKPSAQHQPRLAVLGGSMARAPPRRNASCSLLPSSMATLVPRSTSVKVLSSRVLSGPSHLPAEAFNDDDDDHDDYDGVQTLLASEASGSSIWSTASAARHDSIYLPGSAGLAAVEPARYGRSSLSSGFNAAQLNVKQPPSSFKTNLLANRKASSINPGERPSGRTRSMEQLLPNVAGPKCAMHPVVYS